MKKILLACIATGFAVSVMAQEDSSKVVVTDTTKPAKADTIKVGGMIIIKKPGGEEGSKSTTVTVGNPKKRSANLQTNWWIFDLGFSNYDDNTSYAQTQASGFTGPGINEETMKLRAGKSVNVNIWMFMQKLNVIRHVVNLKYGLGVELNNYRFDNTSVTIQKDPTKILLGSAPAGKVIEKNKLAADYVTVPFMVNFDFTPGRKSGFGFSAGLSAGYLYSARQKFKYNDDNKAKTKDDFDLNRWKVSYIGELTLGPVRLYGSMATKSMWDKGLDQTPYNVGIRFSHF